MAAATCEICGDDWANTQAGWNDAIFVCNNCAGKLSKWDREKEMAKREMDALCQNCYIEPSIGLHEASQFRCCVGCLVWLSEGEAEGSQGGGNHLRIRGIQMESWVTSLKVLGAEFHEPPAVSFSLRGKSSDPGSQNGYDYANSELRRWGLCVACLQCVPRPSRPCLEGSELLCLRDPGPDRQETAPAVGTS